MKHLKFIIIILSLIALSLSACAPSTNTQLSACPNTIIIKDFAFSPANCTVKIGSSITFINEDSAPHTATALFNAPVQFDTGELAAGQSASISFDTAASIPFHCEIHPSMTGSIVVEP